MPEFERIHTCDCESLLIGLIWPNKWLDRPIFIWSCILRSICSIYTCDVQQSKTIFYFFTSPFWTIIIITCPKSLKFEQVCYWLWNVNGNIMEVKWKIMVVLIETENDRQFRGCPSLRGSRTKTIKSLPPTLQLFRPYILAPIDLQTWASRITYKTQA
jgi:hypothetical protein